MTMMLFEVFYRLLWRRYKEAESQRGGQEEEDEEEETERV